MQRQITGLTTHTLLNESRRSCQDGNLTILDELFLFINNNKTKTILCYM